MDEDMLQPTTQRDGADVVAEPQAVEESKPKLPQRVKTPTKETQADQEVIGHATYRPWCAVGVAAKGRSHPHKAAGELEELIACLDHAHGAEGETDATLLLGGETRCGVFAARCFSTRGSTTMQC